MSHHIDEIAADVAAELQAIGADMRAAAQARLSKPAEVRDGPRGGRRVVGSRRGENPRMRSGRLRDAVTAAVSTVGLEATLTVSDAAPYAQRLQGQLGRPVLSDTADEFAETIPDRVAAAIRGQGD